MGRRRAVAQQASGAAVEAVAEPVLPEGKKGPDFHARADWPTSIGEALISSSLAPSFFAFFLLHSCQLSLFHKQLAFQLTSHAHRRLYLYHYPSSTTSPPHTPPVKMGFEAGMFFPTPADVIERFHHATVILRPLSTRTAIRTAIDM